jgi:SAM-dependent methyltransferase
MKARAGGVKRTRRLFSKLCVAYGIAFGWGLCNACFSFVGTKRIATAPQVGSSLMFSISFMHQIRAAELALIAACLPPGSRVLEIGAGTGQQARLLADQGFDISAIEMQDSNYNANRIFPILDYDGRTIPFPDASFDAVFSSNVLEHVPDLATMHQEIRRVLKPNGRVIHVLPTHAWRCWQTLSAFPDALQHVASLGSRLLPPIAGGPQAWSEWRAALSQAIRYLATPFLQRRHGERGILLTEPWFFRPGWWRRNFAANGFQVLEDKPMGLFYTGNMLFGERLSLVRREAMAGWLGSACHLFVLRAA